MSNLMQASRQWASRPDEERFLNLIDLHNHFVAVKGNSREKVIPSRVISAQAEGDDHKGLTVVGPNGGALALTHFSFGQLSQLAGAPAGYLRTLPSELAADNLNYGLHVARQVQDVGVLLYKNGGAPELRAATGPNYGRIWNADIARALVDRFGDGLSGDFRVPGEFGKRVDVTKENTTLYASDRDMFIFLADEERRITVPNRRNGESGSLARGFFVWNSEVGAATFGVAMFLFDYVCCNRIVWGAQGYREIRLRHTASAPTRFLEEAGPTLLEYAKSAASPIEAQVKAAQQKKVDDLDAFLKSRKFTSSQITGIKEAHESDEHRPMETLWDVTVGVTAYARDIKWQDERVAVEREGGKILDLAC